MRDASGGFAVATANRTSLRTFRDREGRRVLSGTTMKDSIQVDSQQRSMYGTAWMIEQAPQRSASTAKTVYYLC